MGMFRLGSQAGGQRFETDWDAVFRNRLARQRAARIAQQGSVAGGPQKSLSDADRVAQQGSVAGGPQRSISNSQRVARQGSVAGGPSRSVGPGQGGASAATGVGGATATTSGGSTATTSGSPGRDPLDNRYGYTGGLQANVTGDRSWYGDGQLPEASVLDLAQNPGMWNTRYAQSRGYGPGVENLLDRYMDPGAAYLLSLGAGEGGDADNLAKLDFAGGFLNNAFNRDLSQGLGGGLRPRDIVQQVFGSSGLPGDESSPLGQMLYGGENAGNWSGQVQQTLQFLEAALYGRMVPEVLGPYLQQLQREGELFMDWKMRNPHLPGNFGQWVLDRLGPTAGL